jgi:hypothetical protein
MLGTLNQIVFENPPWVDYESAAFSLVDETLNGPFALSLQNAVQAKLASIDTSQSVELQRFVALTAHEVAHYETGWFEFDFEPVKPQPLLYDAYGSPISFRDADQKIGRLGDCTEELVQDVLLEVYHRWHLRRLLFLNLVFDLIDGVVQYWNEVALARRAWRSFSGAFRRLLETVLQFKPFHTPLRLFPSSIHPIDSAA